MRDIPASIVKTVLACIVIAVLVLGSRVTMLVIEQQEQNRIVEEYKASERNCLITALYHEARGEGTKGIEAVASVIYNRKHHPYFPANYCGIVNQYKQFSYTLLNKPFGEAIEASLPAFETKVYAEISTVADKMVNDRFKPILEPSVLWYTTKSVHNHWTKKKYVVAQIGKHKFYADMKGKI